MHRVKRFIDAHILEKLLSDRITVPYLFFWARFVLRIRRPFIIGVTGSVGKTTTKQMIAAVLSHENAAPIVGLVGETPRNMNDDKGLPLALLRFEEIPKGHNSRKFLAMALLPFRAFALAFTAPYPKLLVLEFGTHWKGHLHRLARLAPPHIGIVTTIGAAHLERLKTLEGVVFEKSAVVRAVPPSGLVVLGQDHDFVAHLEREARASVVRVSGRGRQLSENITRVVCRRLQIPDEVIDSVLNTFAPPKGRLNRLEVDGLTVIDDTYNANPLSMQLGLDTLDETARPGQRRLAILGGMGELGDDAPTYHEQIGAYARGRADVLVAVGDLARHYGGDYWFPNSDACAEEIDTLIRPGDCVFVKGSASAHMIRVVEKLRTWRIGAPAYAQTRDS